MAGYKYQIITAAAYNFSWDGRLFLLCYFQIYVCWSSSPPPLLTPPPQKNKTDTDLKLIDYSLSLAIWKIIYAVRSVSKQHGTSLSSHVGLFCWTVILSWTGVLVMWLHTFLPLGQRRSSINSQNTGLGWTVSPLVSFQSPWAESRFTLRAMALSVPVWSAWTTTTELTPTATPRATLPKRPVLPPVAEQPLPGPDLQSACVGVVVENFSARGAPLIWPRGTLVAGFLTGWGLPGDRVCLNLTPAPWKLARTRDRGTLPCEKRLDICSAMFEQHRSERVYVLPWLHRISKSQTVTSFRFRCENTPLGRTAS